MLATITGATGLLGANLAELLLSRGWRVRATRRGSSRTEHLSDLDIHWVEAGLDQPDALARAMEGAHAVFHCAAAVSVMPRPTPELVRTNVDGTRSLLYAHRRSGAGRLVHVSSAVCVGLSEDGTPVDERAPYNFEREGLNDGYSQTKLQAERLVLEAVGEGQDAVVVNPTFMFGPRDSKPSSGRVIVEVAHGRLPALPGGANNFVDVRDVAAGMLATWERGRAGQRYLLTGENRPWDAMFLRIGELLGVRVPGWHAPRPIMALIGWGGDLGQWISGKELTINSMAVRWSNTRNFQFTCEKARQELGYSPGDPDDGVRAAIAWFRYAGMIPG